MLEAPSLRPKDERCCKSGSCPRTPRALLHKIYMIYMSYARNKTSNKYFNNKKQLYKGCLGSKKAPKLVCPLRAASGRRALTMNYGWRNPRQRSRGSAPFNKDNFSRQNGRDSNTYIVRGLLLAVALAIQGDFTWSYRLGRRRPFNGVAAGYGRVGCGLSMSSGTVFRSVLFVNFSHNWMNGSDPGLI